MCYEPIECFLRNPVVSVTVVSLLFAAVLIVLPKKGTTQPKSAFLMWLAGASITVVGQIMLGNNWLESIDLFFHMAMAGAIGSVIYIVFTDVKEYMQ